jgi:hypothetical protein
MASNGIVKANEYRPFSGSKLACAVTIHEQKQWSSTVPGAQTASIEFSLTAPPTAVPSAVTDSPSVPLPATQPSVKQSAPFMPEAPTTCCARAQVLVIIKATGSTAVNKSRVKNEPSSLETPQKDIEPP